MSKNYWCQRNPSNLMIYRVLKKLEFNHSSENIFQFIRSCQNLQKLEILKAHDERIRLGNDILKLLPNFYSEWTIKRNIKTLDILIEIMEFLALDFFF